jgi:cytidylate kinase
MTFTKKLIIAIDGYSSCGKSTFAKAIAQKLGYIYIDTGAMYRAVALFALQNKLISDNKINESALFQSLNKIEIKLKKNSETGKNETFLNGENVEEQIRGLEVSNIVSIVSQIKFVREKMVDLQRKMGDEKGIVLDGRDIGTVVFPNADIKLFMTADADVRAKRRYDELIAKGNIVSFSEIKKNILLRDKNDTTRIESPLRKADDAFLLNNSYMTPDEQITWFLDLLKNKFSTIS